MKKDLRKIEKQNKKDADYKLLNVLRREKLKLKIKNRIERKEKRDKANLNNIIEEEELCEEQGNHEMRFFDDELFDDENLDADENTPDIIEKRFDDEISSDEESFSLSEDEKGLIIEKLEDEEKFKHRTINKYIHDDHENLPDFYKEEEEEFYKMQPLDKYNQKISKKQAKKDEYTNRAIRRAEKFKQKLIEENKDKDIKRINKKAMKLKKNRKVEAIRARKGRIVTPRRGIRMVDKRMKKDFRKKDKIKR